MTRAVVAACDGIDGLKDGLIDDPRRCTFDPAKLLCKAGADDAACLTAPQVDAAQEDVRGHEESAHRRADLHRLAARQRGLRRGARARAGAQYMIDPPEPMRVGFFRYFLFHDPNWDFRTIDLERDLAYAEQKLPFMAAVERDLTPFKKSGGKLLMYTGWAGSGRAAARHRRLLRRRREDDGRAGEDARVLPLLHRARHGTLQPADRDRISSTPRRARAVGRERRRAGQADRHRTAPTARSIARARCACTRRSRATRAPAARDEAANFACVEPPAAVRRTTTSAQQ